MLNVIVLLPMSKNHSSPYFRESFSVTSAIVASMSTCRGTISSFYECGIDHPILIGCCINEQGVVACVRDNSQGVFGTSARRTKCTHT